MFPTPMIPNLIFSIVMDLSLIHILRRDGKPTEPPCKGSTFKGPFHVPRSLIMADVLLGDILEMCIRDRFNTNRNNIADLIEWQSGRRIDSLVSTGDNLSLIHI